jgi:hypothetical protein
VKDVPPEQRKANIEQKKREYREMLDEICPSKDIQALAKRLAKRESPCDKCVYCNVPLCMAPYSDNHMEVMNIDPCYEGILLYLRKEMGCTDDNAEIHKLRRELGESDEALRVALQALIALAGMYNSFEDCNEEMRSFLITVAGLMKKDAREMLSDSLSGA